MSKKHQRRLQQQQATQRQQQVAPAPVVKQDDKLSLAKTKVAHLISEIVGVAETHKEFLEAANFCRRFNQAALNYHAAMNFEAAVASDGTKAPRMVDIYWQGNVIASWEPGSHRNGYQVSAPVEQPEPEAEEEEEIITPPPASVVQPEPVPEPVTQPESQAEPENGDTQKDGQPAPAEGGEQQGEQKDSAEQSEEQPEKTAEEPGAEAEQQ